MGLFIVSIPLPSLYIPKWKLTHPIDNKTTGSNQKQWGKDY